MIPTLRKNKIKEGYIALISVILMSALGLAIMLSVVAAGVDATRTDFSLQQSGGARSLASSCAEEALQRVAETGTTSSVGNLVIASGTCMYTITSTNGQNITMKNLIRLCDIHKITPRELFEIIENRYSMEHRNELLNEPGSVLIKNKKSKY